MTRFVAAIFYCSWLYILLLLGGQPLVLAQDISSPPLELTARGMAAFQRGAFETAIQTWRQAAQYYAEPSPTEADGHMRGLLLVRLARAYQALGLYDQATQPLEQALAIARKAGDAEQTATVLAALGHLYASTGPLATAEAYLNEGLSLARHYPQLRATLLNTLGNVFSRQHNYTQALVCYEQGAHLAKDQPALLATILTNTATSAFHTGQYAQGYQHLQKAEAQLHSLEPSHETIYRLITIGLGYRKLQTALPDKRTTLGLQAFSVLQEAARMAESLKDRRALSYAWGYVGALYEERGQHQDALALTRRAVFSAQQANAPESLYRWQWQIGRLLKALNQQDEAIAAYQRAVASLESIRQQVIGDQVPGQSISFRESMGPVYFGLVDLLLQRAARGPTPQQAQQAQQSEQAEQTEIDLRAARDTVELLRVAELHDYFRDACVDAARTQTASLDELSKTAAIIYPILLPDRTELLVSLPDGLTRVTVPISQKALTHAVRVFRYYLEKRTTNEYLPYAQQLYDWLIRPLESSLASVGVDTLVFVPDGPLRTIPMAALHDGERFLIAKYALATTPSLSLTDPRPMSRKNMQVFAAGLSLAVQGFPALPHVETELQAIKQLYGGEPLLNQQFVVPALERALQTTPFSIVHLASHAQFAGEADETFVLTFDGRLSLDQLDQFIGSFRFHDTPLELLTLSACETAAGDDRAALGLAGVAIKAGARSALATLWAVHDQAATALVSEFYTHLQRSSVSRAHALRSAQTKLLADQRYQHPGYWSAFLLLNNWL